MTHIITYDNLFKLKCLDMKATLSTHANRINLNSYMQYIRELVINEFESGNTPDVIFQNILESIMSHKNDNVDFQELNERCCTLITLLNGSQNKLINLIATLEEYALNAEINAFENRIIAEAEGILSAKMLYIHISTLSFDDAAKN